MVIIFLLNFTSVMFQMPEKGQEVRNGLFSKINCVVAAKSSSRLIFNIKKFNIYIQPYDNKRG